MEEGSVATTEKDLTMRQTTSRVPASSGTSHQSAIPMSRLLTWGVGLSSAWSGTGLYLDGWVHTHEPPVSFFTPWHGVIYSGVTLAALFLVGTFLRRRMQGMPAGYGLSLVGVGLFFVGALRTCSGISSLASRPLLRQSIVRRIWCWLRQDC